MNGRKQRVFLVDDHPIVRGALGELINRSADLAVCGEAADAGTALDFIVRSKPDLIIIDISLNGPDGISLLKAIRTRDTRLPILMLSMYDEAIYARRVFRGGANGYITKQEAPEKVLDAIRRVLGGDVYVSERISKNLVRELSGGAPTQPTSAIDEFTDRELEVFRLIGRGYGVRGIANYLHIGVKTVESHQTQIKNKLSLPSTRELVLQALHWMAAQDFHKEARFPLPIAKVQAFGPGASSQQQ